MKADILPVKHEYPKSTTEKQFDNLAKQVASILASDENFREFIKTGGKQNESRNNN